MRRFIDRLREATRLERAWADTQPEAPDTAIFEDLQLLENCLLSSAEHAACNSGQGS